MRDIKFRAWDKDFLKMHWFLEKSHNLPTPQPLHWYLENKDRFDIMQFTGLNDKNGNPIYEGDMLIDERNHGDYSDDVIEVRFVDGKFCYPNYGTFSDLIEVVEYSELIGNIHENKNLLK